MPEEFNESGETIVSDASLGSVVDRLAEKHQAAKPRDGGEDAVSAQDAALNGWDENPTSDADTSANTDDDGPSGDEAQTQDSDATDGDADQQPSQAAPLADGDMGKLVTVKIDGKEQRVTVAEALKGYTRTQDYSQKTAKLAETVRHINTLHQTNTNLARNAYKAAMLMHPVIREIAEMGQDGMAKLAQTDPDRYISLSGQAQAVQNQFNALNGELEKLERNTAGQNLAAEFDRFTAAIPDYADQAKAPELWRSMGEMLTAHGFTKDEIEGINDHRLLKVAHEAAMYRKLMAGRRTVEDRRPEQVPVRPGRAAAPRQNGRAKLPDHVKAALARGDADALVDHVYGS